MSKLLSRENVDQAKLQAFVRNVASVAKLPDYCQFVGHDIGKPDVAIFDFSGKRQAKTQAKFGDPEMGFPLILLCGDALVEPFWPTGTGANRAILSALDAAWILKGFLKHGRLDFSFIGKPVTPMALTQKWHGYYQVMRSAEEADLISNFSLHTIEPRTRYRNLKKV